ncbi:hypothetical protein B0H13DRAFT_187019 [Mycena leptocephala]|nr:hypothetical protein B0H13DRAFT_187019 [Mycena leptocephala]
MSTSPSPVPIVVLGTGHASAHVVVRATEYYSTAASSPAPDCIDQDEAGQKDEDEIHPSPTFPLALPSQAVSCRALWRGDAAAGITHCKRRSEARAANAPSSCRRVNRKRVRQGDEESGCYPDARQYTREGEEWTWTSPPTLLAFMYEIDDSSPAHMNTWPLGYSAPTSTPTHRHRIAVRLRFNSRAAPIPRMRRIRRRACSAVYRGSACAREILPAFRSPF